MRGSNWGKIKGKRKNDNDVFALKLNSKLALIRRPIGNPLGRTFREADDKHRMVDERQCL